jgi:proteic killer suppression protein
MESLILIKGDRAGQFALSLEGAERLVFEPSNNPIPYLNDESIDWSEVTEVCIIFVGDYHD